MRTKKNLYLLLIFILLGCNSNNTTKCVFDRVKGSHSFNSFRAANQTFQTKALKVNMKLIITDTTVTSINCDTQESNTMKIINVVDSHNQKLTLECTDNSRITFIEHSNGLFSVTVTGYGDSTKGVVGKLENVNW